MSRKPISKSQRYDILKRDNFTCQYCGRSAPEVRLEVDHVMPVSKGGNNSNDNLKVACRYCNGGKSNKVSGGTDVGQQIDALCRYFYVILHDNGIVLTRDFSDDICIDLFIYMDVGAVEIIKIANQSKSMTHFFKQVLHYYSEQLQDGE